MKKIECTVLPAHLDKFEQELWDGGAIGIMIVPGKRDRSSRLQVRILVSDQQAGEIIKVVKKHEDQSF
jgi:nitrogen regulatory protein PII